MVSFFKRLTGPLIFILSVSSSFAQSNSTLPAKSSAISEATISRLVHLENQLHSVKTTKEKIAIVLKSNVIRSIPRLDFLLGKLESSPAEYKKGYLRIVQEGIQGYITYYGSRSDARKINSAALKAEVKSIKQKNGYHDSSRNYHSNWFQKFLEKFRFHFPSPKFPNSKLPNFSVGLVSIGQILVWSILAILMVGFAIWAILRFSRNKGDKRVKKALLDESEEGVTRNEWLIRAEELEARGEYRMAIRCYYIATLLRFDEARIARFEPNETNWDHLRRIKACAKLPKEIDFLPSTTLFDKAWYGDQHNGSIDCAFMKENYENIDKALIQSTSSGALSA